MLVNPYIEGKTNNVFQADNSLKAAKMAYETVSKYFNNSVSNFNMSLLKLKSDAINDDKKVNIKHYGGSNDENKRFDAANFSHFTVSEKPKKNGQVDFSITKYQGEVKHLDQLINNIKLVQKKVKKASDNNTPVENLSDDKHSSSSESVNSDKEQKGAGIFDKKDKKKSKYEEEDDDDDDDDDDSPDYIVKREYVYDPILYWYYTPSLYKTVRVYMPTFVSPLSFPYVLDIYPSISYNTGPTVSLSY